MLHMRLLFCCSTLIVSSSAKQLRANVPVPQVKAYLNAAEFERHRRSLVASTSGSQPEVLLGHRHDAVGANLSGVCEEEVNAKCSRQTCETGEPCAALGKIHRMRRNNFPSVMGNSPGSHCAVSKQHKFIFVHVLKNAGSSTKKWLREATSCPENKHPCLVEDVDCYNAMLAFPDFFRWTWARHPFDRALSVYGMAKHYGLDPSVNFADFWLSKDRWAKTYLSPDHARPQAKFVLDDAGCLAVDYVAKLDDASVEWPHILNMLGSKILKGYQEKMPFMQPEEGNVFGKEEAANASVANGRELVKRDPALKAILLEEFKEDFDLFY